MPVGPVGRLGRSELFAGGNFLPGLAGLGPLGPLAGGNFLPAEKFDLYFISLTHNPFAFF